MTHALVKFIFRSMDVTFNQNKMNCGQVLFNYQNGLIENGLFDRSTTAAKGLYSL